MLWVDIQAVGFALCIADAHINPSLSAAAKKATLVDVWDCISVFLNLPCMLEIGTSREDRYSMGADAFGPPDDAIAHVFDEHNGHLIDIVQPSITRRQIIDGELTSLSRRDRIYVSLPPAELVDRRPFAGDVWFHFRPFDPARPHSGFGDAEPPGVCASWQTLHG